jgi:hypothetical protein
MEAIAYTEVRCPACNKPEMTDDIEGLVANEWSRCAGCEKGWDEDRNPVHCDRIGFLYCERCAEERN